MKKGIVVSKEEGRISKNALGQIHLRPVKIVPLHDVSMR